MRLSTTPFLILLLLLTITALQLDAQPALQDSLISDSGYAAAIQQYHSAVYPEPGLYRGPQYVDYEYTIQKGQPYLGSNHPRLGSVWYNGVMYTGRSMLYDIVKDQLVIAGPADVYRIALLMDFVDSFRLDGQLFFRVRDSLASASVRKGYLDRIYQGRLELEKRDTKTVHENLMITPDNVKLFILESIDYYLKKDGRYYRVNTKKELYDALADRKSDVRRLLRKSKLSWRTDKEQLLLQVAALYDAPNH